MADATRPQERESQEELEGRSDAGTSSIAAEMQPHDQAGQSQNAALSATREQTSTTTEEQSSDQQPPLAAPSTPHRDAALKTFKGLQLLALTAPAGFQRVGGHPAVAAAAVGAGLGCALGAALMRRRRGAEQVEAHHAKRLKALREVRLQCETSHLESAHLTDSFRFDAPCLFAVL
jgi:hypothetical protein